MQVKIKKFPNKESCRLDVTDISEIPNEWLNLIYTNILNFYLMKHKM